MTENMRQIKRQDIFLESLIRQKRSASRYTDTSGCGRFYFQSQALTVLEQDWIEIIW